MQLGVAFTLKQKYRAKAIANFRETSANGFSSDYDPLSIETSCFSLAAVGYAPLGPTAFRVGLGPAINFVRAAPIYGEAKLVTEQFNKSGFVVEGGYNSFFSKRFSADLQLQYFYVGKGDLGTYALEGTDLMENSVTKNVSLSDTRFSSLFFSLGIGYMLGKAE